MGTREKVARGDDDIVLPAIGAARNRG